MTSIFIDSSALIALHNASDKLHSKALSIVESLDSTETLPVISLNIILESITVISQKVGKKEALSALADLRSGRYKIIEIDDKIISLAENIFSKEKSKNISYSDCLSFSIMKTNNYSWCFSFDAHFKKQGFKRIGLDGNIL